MLPDQFIFEGTLIDGLVLWTTMEDGFSSLRVVTLLALALLSTSSVLPMLCCTHTLFLNVNYFTFHYISRLRHVIWAVFRMELYITSVHVKDLF